jgi:hypothetical protein
VVIAKNLFFFKKKGGREKKWLENRSEELEIKMLKKQLKKG